MKKLPKSFSERLDFAALSEEEKDIIREKASKMVAAEKKTSLEEAYLQQAIHDERAKDDPALQYEDVLIDLPGHALRIMIDGVEFFHAFTYRLSTGQAATIRETMQRCWEHEDEIGGANRNFYQRPLNRTLTPRGTITTSRLQGV